MSLSRVILDLWQKNILFFKWKSTVTYNMGLESFSKDFTSLAKEYSETTRTTRYIHPVGVADDAVFSLNYAVCASHILEKDFSISALNEESLSDFV
jgi:hypothetical protein